MHSESLSDHDLMNTYLDKRLAQCVSDDERGDMKGVMEFEAKHRTCFPIDYQPLPFIGALDRC